MSIYNAEHYLDPTPYEAARNIEREIKKYRPLVYICSAFSGDIAGNTEKARRYCRYAVDQGMIPLAPHLLLPQFMSEEKERDLALHMGIVLLRHCREVWVFGISVTPGMKAEIKEANKRNIKVRYISK